MKLKHMLFAVFALALTGGLLLLWLAPRGLQQAPDVTVTSVEGEPIRISGLRGRPLLVNFWSTTCNGCLKEMPHLAELYRELSPKGLEVIGIAMAYDPPNRVVAFSRAGDIPYPLALDLDNQAALAFGDVQVTPMSFLIAPDGSVVHQQAGALNMQRVRSLVIDMLARSPQSRSIQTLAVN